VRDSAVTNIRERLELLEKYGFESKDMSEWREMLQGLLQIRIENLAPDHWINSEDLREFFRREKTTYHDRPISAGAGGGVY
jgi:hypothetical protein